MWLHYMALVAESELVKDIRDRLLVPVKENRGLLLCEILRDLCHSGHRQCKGNRLCPQGLQYWPMIQQAQCLHLLVFARLELQLTYEVIVSKDKHVLHYLHTFTGKVLYIKYVPLPCQQYRSLWVLNTILFALVINGRNLLLLCLRLGIYVYI